MIPADLEALAGLWEQQSAAASLEAAKTTTAKAARDARASVLREKARELRAIINPRALTSAARVIVPVALQRKFFARAAEYGIAPLYWARCLTDQAVSGEPASAVRITIAHLGMEIVYQRTSDDSKLVLPDEAPASGLLPSVQRQKGGQ